MKRRVVVTGMGVVSPIGIGVKDFGQALFEGKNGVSKITYFDVSSYRSQIGGEFKDFEPQRCLSPKEIRRLDRFAQLGMIAA